MCLLMGVLGKRGVGALQGSQQLLWVFPTPNKWATYHPQAPSTQQPCRQMGMEKGGWGPHLLGSPSFHEEVFLQRGVGFH